MRAQWEDVLGRAAEAVHAAPPGQVIARSEEQVRDLVAVFRRQAYQLAVPMRVDAAEAALPPSAGPADRQAPAPQRSPRTAPVHRPGLDPGRAHLRALP